MRVLVPLVLLALACFAGDYTDITYTGVTVGVLTEATGFKTRLFRLHNYCTESVSYLVTSGAYSGSIKCTSDSSCPSGFSCNTANNICYWKIPKPASGSYTLASGADDTLEFPVYDNGIADVTWSGNMRFCRGAQCSSDAATCAASGCSSSGPITMAEFTLQRTNSDYYDVSNIHGFSTGVEMTPRFDRPSVIPSYWNPWWCGAAGGAVPITPKIGGCSWEFTPPSNVYRWVAKGGSTCTSDSDCTTSGEVCGVSDTPGTTKRLDRTCGALLGYWSANQMCGIICTDGLPCTALRTGVTDWVGCQSTAPLGSAYELMACGGVTQYAQSCYSSGAVSTCCGCANWDTEGVSGAPITGTNYTVSCVSSNSAWHTLVKPGLLFLKSGCPSAYTFPYDDISSTFTCNAKRSNGTNSQNAVVYYINMCPQLAPSASSTAEVAESSAADVVATESSEADIAVVESSAPDAVVASSDADDTGKSSQQATGTSVALASSGIITVVLAAIMW